MLNHTEIRTCNIQMTDSMGKLFVFTLDNCHLEKTNNNTKFMLVFYQVTQILHPIGFSAILSQKVKKI